MKVRVRLEGCDDSTDVMFGVTKDQLTALERLSDETMAVGGGCAPVMVLLCPEKVEVGFGRFVPCSRPPGHDGECERD